MGDTMRAENLRFIEEEIETLTDTARSGKRMEGGLLVALTGEEHLKLMEKLEELKQDAARIRVELEEEEKQVSVFGSLGRLDDSLRLKQTVYDYSGKPLTDGARNQIQEELTNLRQRIAIIVQTTGGTVAPSLAQMKQATN